MQPRMTLTEYRRSRKGSLATHQTLTSACVRLLELQGIPAAAINQIARRRRDGSYHTPGAPTGFPDVVACVPIEIRTTPAPWTTGDVGIVVGLLGRLLLLEVKTGRSELRPAQVGAALKWTRAGAMWGVVRSIDELPAIIAEARNGGRMHPAGGGPA